MTIQVLIAHTGASLHADGASFESLDGFKKWVTQETAISVKHQISLTAAGKSVQLPALATEKYVIIYDRRILQPATPKSPSPPPSEVPIPAKYRPTEAPDSIVDQTDLQAWRDLFMKRRAWALRIVDDTGLMSTECEKRYGEIDGLIKAVDAAYMNLAHHVKNLDQKNADTQSWAKDIQKQQDLVGTDWEAIIARLQSIPAKPNMIKFITKREKGKGSKPTSLQDLIDAEEVKKAGRMVLSFSTELHQKGKDLGGKVDEVLRRTDKIIDKVEKSLAHQYMRSSPESKQLMEDIEAIAKKVNSDYETVLTAPNTSKSVSQASKSALVHTKNFLPSLLNRALEMDELRRLATEQRNTIAAESHGIMHDLAEVTWLLSEANAQFASMEMDGDGYDALNLLLSINSLPVTYSSFLVETIRRKEWNDKVKSDTSTLANEMATFQDEEFRRRRKWQKKTGSALWGDRTERKVIGLEINLHGEEEEWPQATRADLEELLSVLQRQDIITPGMIDEVKGIISELNVPTKQQSRRAKAFKAGSIHEAALGRSALLTRGDDDLIRSLQDDNAKAESRAKTAESRVRRLEDLLHRQTHVSRTSTGGYFQLPGNPSPEAQPTLSPRLLEDVSRRSSVSSRRFSANQGADERVLQQKMLSLEAELIAERERASGLEKEVSARTSSAANMKNLADEANSTKKDLMDNFDAQQREFIEERKSLEDEIKRLRVKQEELEDELEHYSGSRENDRSAIDDRIRSMQDDIDEVRRDAAAEKQKAQGQVEFLRNDARLQRDANESLERQLQKSRDENQILVARIEKAEQECQEQWQALCDIHAQVAKGSTTPNDFGVLRDAIISISGDLVSELESVKSDAVIARSDRDAAQAHVEELKSGLSAAETQASAAGAETLRLRETLDAEQAKFSALERELSDERNQLSTLRTKMSDGETGSEALRNRLEEEEQKVTAMSEDLASRLSRIGSLEEEVRSLEHKYQSAHEKYDKLLGRFEARTGRAKDLTQRAYAQNDRLCRLLERLNFSVTRDGGSMIIQKLPRPDRSTPNLSSDPDSSVKRSMSGSVSRKSMVDSGDLDLLYWMHNDDLEIEAKKYEAYLNSIGNFDVEAFCEVISKRFKDLDFTVKKFLKDSRAYREKSHIAQKDAHNKVAFKSFKEGDLALFLPTRNQSTGAWAAFNVGAPHYFLKEQDSHKLHSRDWLVARIHKIQERVVDLSKSMTTRGQLSSDGRSLGEASNGGDSYEDDNPFDLSDGLQWYLIHASEEKPGAPSTPGLGKSTVASAKIDATGSIRRTKKASNGVEGINKTLSKSLDSRRSSTNSKKGLITSSPLARPGSATSLLPQSGTPVIEEASVAQRIPTGSGQDSAVDGDRTLKAESSMKSQTSTSTSPAKRSVIWDSLWSLDLSLESSGRNRGARS